VAYIMPSGPVRSDGEPTKPLTPEQKSQADDYLRRIEILRRSQDYYADFFQWRRITEDVLHYTPFDSLPHEQQLAIIRRRQKAFQESYIPWIVTDATSLLTGIDDIDDFLKSAQFLKEYAVTPLARAIGKGFPATPYDANPILRAWRRNCDRRIPKRQRKLGFVNAIAPNRFPAGLLPALLGLFPGWRFWALAMQFAQTTDGLFGVGLQLGPLIGGALELLFRGAAALGLPFGPEGNKYHQILGARATQHANQLLAAHQAMHPEDTLSVLATLDNIASRQLIPYDIIAPQDYPDAFQMFQHPWQQLENFAGLAFSIPYNIQAGLVNNLLGPVLQDWSLKIEGGGVSQIPQPELDNFPRWVLERIAKGICPTAQCDAELLQALAFLAQASRRTLVLPTFDQPELSIADKLQFLIDYLLPQLLEPTGLT